MAIVIHTRKDKYRYAYEHTRVGDKIVTNYLYPVDADGNIRNKYQDQVAQHDKKVAQPEITEYQKLKNEYERLRAMPKPENETIDEMFERQDKVNKARERMNKANPKFSEQIKQYDKERKEYLEKQKIKTFVTKDNIKKNMIISKDNRLFQVVKVSRVYCYVLSYPHLPQIDKPKKIRINDLSTYEVN